MSRAVLVTGSSRGIGAAVAAAFATDGDRVAVHYRSGRAEAKAVLAGLPGDGHTMVQADVADADAVHRMVEEAADALDGIDVLVNNAAVFREHRIGEVDYAAWRAEWQQTLETNLLGPANVVFCALPYLRRSGAGRVVNVSSRGAFRGEPNGPAYAASKAGLNAFGQSMALVLAQYGIAVTTVAPGFVETAMARQAMGGQRAAEVRAQSPFNRVARVDEIAAAVRYLASPEAEWASGSVLDLNGASYLRT